MKNILKMIVPCMALLLTFSSCYSTMDDKSDIDAKYASATTTTVTLAEVNVDMTSIVANFNVAGIDVIEQGIEVAAKEDFSDATAYAVEEGNTISVSDLPELTTLYVRAYAVTKGAGTVVSSAKKITTGGIPVFPIAGTYTCDEYKFDSNAGTWAVDDQYTIAIASEPGSNDVLITGIWGYPLPVEGTYDPATNIVTVDSYSIIGTHSSYGEVWIRGVNDAVSAYTNTIEFKFTPKGGAMVSSNFAVQVSAGSFGFFKLQLKHD